MSLVFTRRDMHARYYQRRLQHAERTYIQKRNPAEDDVDDAAGFTLTGPITITVTTTISSAPSSTAPVAVSTTISSSSSSSSTITTIGQETAPPSPSSTSNPPTAPSPSVILPSPSPSINSAPLESNSLSPTRLSSGAVAGIVIGCLIFLFAGLFFTMRRRFMRNRAKLRRLWTGSKAVSVPSAGITGSSFEPKLYTGTSFSSGSMQPGEASPGMQFPRSQANALAISIPTSTVPAPPASYNNEHAPSSLSISPTSAARSPTAFTSPIYSPGSATLSPFAATVVCTFIVSLPDELPIQIGETLRVLAEYDDGWVLCMNMSGEQGMIPLECLNRGGSAFSGLVVPRERDARGSRRMSSLDPTAQALMAYRS